jgi:hypothetical protein
MTCVATATVDWPADPRGRSTVLRCRRQLAKAVVANTWNDLCADRAHEAFAPLRWRALLVTSSDSGGTANVRGRDGRRAR